MAGVQSRVPRIRGAEVATGLHAWTTAAVVAAAAGSVGVGSVGVGLLDPSACLGLGATVLCDALRQLLVAGMVAAPLWLGVTLALVGIHATSDVSSTERGLLAVRVVLYAVAASVLAFDPTGVVRHSLS